MDVESSLTKKTYIKLLVLLTLRTWLFYFFIGLIFALFLTELLTKSSPIFGTVFLAVAILFYTIWLLYNISSKKSKNISLKKHFIFSDENILVKASMGEQIIQWDAFYKWEKFAGHYMLYLTNGNWFVIGESDIPASEIPSIEKLLRLKIDKTVLITPTKIN